MSHDQPSLGSKSMLQKMAKAKFLFYVVALSWLYSLSDGKAPKLGKRIISFACCKQVLRLYVLASRCQPAPPLSPQAGSFLVDTNGISISGISSGGYFAVQFHVAFSKTIMGAGILAGGTSPIDYSVYFWAPEAAGFSTI